MNLQSLAKYVKKLVWLREKKAYKSKISVRYIKTRFETNSLARGRGNGSPPLRKRLFTLIKPQLGGFWTSCKFAMCDLIPENIRREAHFARRIKGRLLNIYYLNVVGRNRIANFRWAI